MKKQHKNVIRRTVAVGLATLMFFVPLSTGFGEGKGAKADDPPSGGIVTTKTDDHTIKQDIVKIENDGASSPTVYTEIYKALESNPETINYRVLDDTIGVQVTAAVMLDDSKKQMTIEATEPFYMQVQGYLNQTVDVKVTPIYKVTFSGVENKIVPYGDGNAKYYKDLPITALEGNEFTLDSTHNAYGLYSKLQVEKIEKEFKFERTSAWDVPAQLDKPTDGDQEKWGYYYGYQNAARDKYSEQDISNVYASYEDPATYETLYSLQCIYKYQADDYSDYEINNDWDYLDVTIPDNTNSMYICKCAAITIDVLPLVPSETDCYVGEFKHALVNHQAVNTPYSEEEVTLANIPLSSWSRDRAETTATGYYYDYVAYFIGDQLIKYIKKSDPVYIDADAPVVESLGLFRATKNATGDTITEWHQMNVGEGYVLNLGEGSDSENDAYCYVVRTEDADSGVKSVTGHIEHIDDPKSFEIEDGSIDFYNYSENKIAGGNLYCYMIQYEDLPDNGELKMTVNAEDNVGNKLEEDIIISPTVKKFKSYLNVSVALSVDGQPIAELPARSQKPVKLTIEVSSGSPITYIDLYNNGKSLGRITRADVEDETHFVDRESTVGGATMHAVTWKGYVLPATPNNAKYTDLRLEVKDDYVYTGRGGSYWKEFFESKHKFNKPLDDGNLIYDITVPVISYSDEYDGVRWYQDYKVSGNIVSGIQDVEDDFEYAEYYMSPEGSVDENGSPTKVLYQDEGAQKPTCSFEFDVAPSENLIGTRIVFAAKDKSGNILPDDNRTMIIHVDGEAPVIDKDAIYVVKKGTAEGKKVSSDSNLEGGNVINGNPVLQASVRDNLTIDRVEYTVKFPNGSEKIYEDTKVKGLDAPGVDYPLAFEIPNPSGAGEALDGSYEVTIQAYDKSGRESEKQSVRFVLDNTKPVLSSWISVGTKGGKSPREDGTDWYYKSDQVGVSFKIEDDNIDTSKLVVKDGDSIVHVEWTGGNGFASISGNGSHTLTFEGTDAVGNQGTTQTVSFIIDTVEPTVSVQINGQAYSASRGRINSTQDVYVKFSPYDVNPDYNDYYCRIVRQLPGQADSVREYTATSMTDYSFSEDGDYTVTFYAIDRAGNSSGVYSAMFRVDKNAPQLQIVGANGSATSDTAVTLVVNEAMWQDATAEATIYRRAGDGKEELVYKTIQLRLTSAETRISELLRETGTYRIEFSAKDAIGHSTSTSHTFTLDKNAPIVSQTGVSNYDKTDQPVTFYTEIHDDFYATKTVVVSGTRTDQSGKVTVLEFPNVKQNANPTIIENVFEEDGIYEVSVYVRDAAGNEKSSVLHFVIDKEAPVIGSLEDYEDKMFREFSWDLDLDELVSDLTVCDVHMYLNGREYDGESKIEDGVYTLLITAEDELGHKSEKSVTFTLDTKAPVFIVTGVEDGEVKKEAYSIDISLQLDEDILELVMLNGVPATVRENNTAHIDVTQEGDYNLTMAAADKAGNESMQVISFTYGTERQKRNWLVVVLASGGGVLALGGSIFFAAKRRRNR